MIRVKLRSVGVGLPEKIVTNNDLTKFLDTSDEWIVARTGIRERRIADKESLLELCEKASRQALERANLQPEDLDMIIVSTLTEDRRLPNVSCSLQNLLNAPKAVCFDISAACSGFIYASNIARSFIRCGEAKNVLVMGGEILSKIMDWEDRSTCVLFGDGAGAAVIGISDDETGVLAVDLGTDGKRSRALRFGEEPIENPYRKDVAVESRFTHMEGQEVFKFAVSQVPKSIHKVLDEAGKKPEDVDYYLLHQANMRIIKAVAKHLGQPDEKFLMNIQRYGNTSAASIPILLNENLENGTIKKGDLILLAGFGGGLTWGSMLIQL